MAKFKNGLVNQLQGKQLFFALDFLSLVFEESVKLILLYIYSNLRAMNEFISPHQNININISYNLGTDDKMPKVVFGKKIAKIVKSTVKEQPKSFFKTFKKNEEHIIPSEEIKKGKSSKKTKPKKKSNTLLTLPDQQEPLPRRLKTEGNTKAEIGNSLMKRQQKSNSKAFSKNMTQHFKSLNNPPTSQNKSIIKKPSTSLSRPKKEDRRNSNKSCILYQPKKHILLSDVEHIISTTTSGPTPVNRQSQPTKKRANSASVIKSDKFINKLLDMSVLTSELGGSIPMNQDKVRAAQNTNNRIKTALQGFMSSIDMRIIKKMEQDNQTKKNILVDFNIGQGLELITFLNKIRRIPMEKLNDKATRIQRFWRKKQGQSIIPYYSNMFFRNPAINSKAAIEQHLEEISEIQIDENIDSQIGTKKEEKAGFLDLISAAKVSETSQSQNFQQSSISAAKINKMLEKGLSNVNESPISQKREDEIDEFTIEGQQKTEQKSNEVEAESSSKSSLNIQKYRQLVKQSIEEQTKPSHKARPTRVQEGESSEQNRVQNKDQVVTQAHWNHVHNILSSNMSKKVPLMSKTVLEELMKQSAYNKQWVEGQFSNSESRKISTIPSPRTNAQKLSQAVENEDGEYYFMEKQQEEGPENEQYNWSKYSDIGKLKKPQEITVPRLKDKQKALREEQKQIKQRPSSIQQPIPGLLPAGIKNNNLFTEEFDKKERSQKNDIELGQQLEDTQKDQKWIREQMIMEDGIVEKYLDCGLDYFGLNLNKKIETDPEGNATIQQLQEKEVEQKEEHKATLQKEHNVQIQSSREGQAETHPHKDDDIFSNETIGHAHDDDMELVYVFQNIDGKKKDSHPQIDQDHAAKNSKRNDNVDHLGIRQENNFVRADPKPNNLPLFEPSFEKPPENEPYTSEQISIQEELKTKRKQKITQQIITRLIEEFAQDVSSILRKSHQQESKDATKLYQMGHPSQIKALPPSNLSTSNSGMGILTSFQSIRDFITKIKNFVLQDQPCCRKIIENLKNNIGPSSMEILSYLRIEDQNEFKSESEPEAEEEDNQEWLFVIPNDLFEVFNKKLLDEEEQNRGKKLSNKFKLYTEFWHRSIFECYNECLDYERPYGITGAPYTWICEPKLPRPILYSQPKVLQILESAQNRLLELSCSSSGIIFDKPESPYRQFDLSEEHRVQMNEEKISRMLANEILDDEHNWITYNDEITELLVDISRKVQELLVFQVSTDIKKIMRRRKMMVHVGRQKGQIESSSEDDQHVVFMVEDLV